MSILVINSILIVVYSGIIKHCLEVCPELIHVSVWYYSDLLLVMLCCIYFSLNRLQVHRCLDHLQVVPNLLCIYWFPKWPTVLMAHQRRNYLIALLFK